MGKFLFQLIGTLITLSVIGFIGYCLFTRLFQSFEDKEQQEKVVNISAKVSDLEIEHNVTHQGKQGMNVITEQVYKNLEGKKCYTMLRFFDTDGKPLKGKSIKDEDGDFVITGSLVPDDEEYENTQRIFVAYDQFDIPDEGLAYFLCDIWLFILDGNGKRVELAHSQPSRFHLSH